MKNAIKVIAFVIAVVIVGSLGCYIYFTWDVGEFEYYDGAEKGTVIISAYIGSEKEVVVPKTLRGKKVVAIDDRAFKDKDITSVVIGKNVRTIGSNVFQGCKNLISVDLGQSVETIGDMVFSDCDSLTEVKFSPVLKNIGQALFRNDEKLTLIDVNGNSNFEFSDGILYSKGKTILYETLKSANLTEFTLPETVVELRPMAFYWQENLKSVKLNSNITNIPDGCFSMCTSMTELEIPDSVQSIGNLVIVGSGIERIKVPDSAIKINDYAFEHNEITVLDDDGNPVLDENGEELKEYEHQVTIVTVKGSVASTFADRHEYNLEIVDAL